MKAIAYLCHPISGDVTRNIQNLLKIIQIMNASNSKVIPFAPYIADIMALGESELTKEIGMANNKEYFDRRVVDMVYVFGQPTQGMEQEIQWALDKGIFVQYYPPSDEFIYFKQAGLYTIKEAGE